MSAMPAEQPIVPEPDPPAAVSDGARRLCARCGAPLEPDGSARPGVKVLFAELCVADGGHQLTHGPWVTR